MRTALKYGYYYGSGGAAAASFTAEYQAVLDRAVVLGYTAPSASQQILQNQLVVDLKAAGIWTLLDVFYNFLTDGSSDFATLNWKAPTLFKITKVNSPVLQRNVGFQGNNTTSYLNTGWAPSAGVNYTLNNCSHGCFLMSSDVDTKQLYGVIPASNRLSLNPASSDGVPSYRLNSTGFSQPVSTDPYGFWHAKRTASNVVALFRNGASLHTDTTVSTGLETHAVYLLSFNTGVDTATSFSARILSNWWAGASLNGLEAAFNTAWNTYMVAAIAPISITGRSNMEAFGDSITFGYGVAPDADHYIERFNTLKAAITVLRDNSENGRGVLKAVTVSNTITFTPGVSLVTAMLGLNDIRQSDFSNAKTSNKINDGFRGLILRCLLSNVIGAGNAAITRVGSHIGYAANTVGGLFATGAVPGNVATSLEDTQAGSWSWPFTGTQFGIQFIGCDGVAHTHGSVTVKIDGVLIDTIDLNNRYDGVATGGSPPTNAIGPTPKTYHGYTNAAHTVLVEKVGTTGRVPIDHFTTLIAPASAPAIIVLSIPYLTTAGYNFGDATVGHANLTITDQVNTFLEAIVNEFIALGYPMRWIDTNKYYNLFTGVQADGIHPNTAGQAQIYTALRANVSD